MAADLDVMAAFFKRASDEEDFSDLVVPVSDEAKAAARDVFGAGEFFRTIEAAHSYGQLESNPIVVTSIRSCRLFGETFRAGKRGARVITWKGYGRFLIAPGCRAPASLALFD